MRWFNRKTELQEIAEGVEKLTTELVDFKDSVTHQLSVISSVVEKCLRGGDGQYREELVETTEEEKPDAMA